MTNEWPAAWEIMTAIDSAEPIPEPIDQDIREVLPLDCHCCYRRYGTDDWCTKEPVAFFFFHDGVVLVCGDHRSQSGKRLMNPAHWYRDPEHKLQPDDLDELWRARVYEALPRMFQNHFAEKKRLEERIDVLCEQLRSRRVALEVEEAWMTEIQAFYEGLTGDARVLYGTRP